MKARTEDEIAGEMIAYLGSFTGLTNWRTGSVATQIVYAIARQIAQLEEKVVRMRDACFLETATVEDLAALALEYTGQGRRGPTKASGGDLVFLRQGIGDELIVPAGTIVIRPGDNLQYETLQDAVFGANDKVSSAVAVVCTRAGVIGNSDRETITKVQNPPEGVIGCKNTTPVQGGEDVEGATAMRQRILRYRSSLLPCTRKGIEAALLSIEDPTWGRIAHVKWDVLAKPPVVYISNAAGTCNISETITAGELLLSRTNGQYYAYLANFPLTDDSDIPYVVATNLETNETVSIACRCIRPWGLVVFERPLPQGYSVRTGLPYKVWRGLVAIAQKRIDGRDNSMGTVPPGITVTVKPARRVSVHIYARVIVPFGLNVAAIDGDLKRALQTYVYGLSIGEGITIARIIEVIMRNGLVRNVYDVKINGTHSDYDCAPYDIVRISTDDITLDIEGQK